MVKKILTKAYSPGNFHYHTDLYGSDYDNRNHIKIVWTQAIGDVQLYQSILQ